MADIWIRIDSKTGSTKGAYFGGKLVAGKRGRRHAGSGKGKKKKGDKTNSGETVTTAPYDSEGQVLETDKDGDGVSNPCCYRDSRTGEEWCWC